MTEIYISVDIEYYCLKSLFVQLSENLSYHTIAACETLYILVCAKRWSGVFETPSWSGVLKTPSWSVVYDFSVDVFCKLGIDK
jgi:hypothetical protein